MLYAEVFSHFSIFATVSAIELRQMFFWAISCCYTRAFAPISGLLPHSSNLIPLVDMINHDFNAHSPVAYANSSQSSIDALVVIADKAYGAGEEYFINYDEPDANNLDIECNLVLYSMFGFTLDDGDDC